MKRIGKIVTAVGVVTALLAGCCLDSQDVYGYLAGAVCIIGGFLGGAGYAIYMLAERRRTEVVIEMDKPDIVWIEIEEVGKWRSRKNRRLFPRLKSRL